MRKRITISCLLLFGLAIALIGGYWLLLPQPRIDQATLDKIEIGMTEREVIDIIGVPAGNHGLGEGELECDGWLMDVGIRMNGIEAKTWLGQKDAIQLHFDPHGTVTAKHHYGVWRQYDSHFDMLCQRLQLTPRKQRPPVTYYLSDSIGIIY